jgi:hypothetical protein
MIRKTLAIAAAVCMPLGVVGLTGGSAFAGGSPSVATDSIHCTTEVSTVDFSIPLTSAGATSGIETDTISGTVSGCTVTGSFAVTGTVTGTVSGSISTGKAASAKKPCCTLAGLTGTNKEKGTLTVTWTDSDGTPIPASVTSLKAVVGGLDPTNTYGAFTVQGKSKGSFLGTNKGGSDNIYSQTNDTVATLATESSISSLGLNGGTTGLTLG